MSTEIPTAAPPTAAVQTLEAAKVALANALERGTTADSAALASKVAAKRSVAQTADLLRGPPAEKATAQTAAAPPSAETSTAPEAPPEIKRFYSATARGFFSDDFHHPSKMPADVVAITHDEWAALLEAQSQGKEITVDQAGRPIAIDPVDTPDVKRRKIQYRLDALDTKSSRAYREHVLSVPVAAGQPTALERLQGYEQQAVALRAQLQELKS